MIALSPTQSPLAWTWDGSRLNAFAAPESHLPFTSSSFETKSVLEHRRRRFREKRQLEVEDLEAFHRGFDPQHGAHSVCMMRPDAQTWSISHIRVDAKRVRYDYQSRDLGQIAFHPSISLALARS
jgi:hypothetical protein